MCKWNDLLSIIWSNEVENPIGWCWINFGGEHLVILVTGKREAGVVGYPLNVIFAFHKHTNCGWQLLCWSSTCLKQRALTEKVKFHLHEWKSVWHHLSAHFCRLQRSIEIYERGYNNKNIPNFLFVLINYRMNQYLKSQFIVSTFERKAFCFELINSRWDPPWTNNLSSAFIDMFSKLFARSLRFN